MSQPRTIRFTPSSIRAARTCVAALIALLSGCGGGGGGGAAGDTSTPSGIRLGGSTAVGTPIANATVNIICVAGSPVASTTTDSAGNWAITLAGQTLPCAAQVSGGTVNGIASGATYTSIATAEGTVNITPLTDLLVASLVSAASPSDWFAGLNTNRAALGSITQGQVDTALARLSTALSGLGALGTTNPITTAFTPTSGNTSDDMLTALQNAMVAEGLSYPELLADASTAAVPTGLNAALATAYGATLSGSAASFSGSAIAAVLGLPQPIPIASNGACGTQTTEVGTFECIVATASLPSAFDAFSGSAVYLTSFPTLDLTAGSGSCSGGVDPGSGAMSLTSGSGNDSLAFTNSTVIDFSVSPSWLASIGASGFISQLIGLIYIDNSTVGHIMVIAQVNGSITVVMSLHLTNLSLDASKDTGPVVICTR